MAPARCASSIGELQGDGREGGHRCICFPTPSGARRSPRCRCRCSAACALASDNKIAVAPGGPHPYFAPWEQAAADAKKDFGIADVEYKVPTDWKLELQTELLESLASQGFKGFGIFPGDPVGVNSTITELKGAGHSGRRARRLHRRSDRCGLLLRDRPLQDHLHHDQGADRGHGRQGQHRSPDRPI